MGHGGGSREVPPWKSSGLGAHRRGRVRKARFQPKGALGSPWHNSFGELLSSCCKSCFQLLLFQALIHTISIGPAIPSCKNRQDRANKGWKSSRLAQCLSHRYFQDARVKDVPSQLSMGATGTHLLVPKLLLLPQRVPHILVLIMNSSLHPSAPAAPTKNTS